MQPRQKAAHETGENKMNKTHWSIALILLAGGLSAWWFIGRDTGAGTAGKANEPTATTEERAEAPGPESTAPASASRRASGPVSTETISELFQPQREVSATAVNEEQAILALEVDTVSSSAEFKRVQEAMDAALALDAEALDRVVEQSSECYRFSAVTQRDVDNEMEFMRQRFRESRRADVQEERFQEVIEQRRDLFDQRRARCSWRHAPEYPDYRDQVARLAERGDVIARFLYLALKPSPVEPDYLIEMEEWAANAQRFSIANVREQQTAGYLAQAITYSYGMYTYSDARLAGIWHYLLFTCPHSGPVPANYLNDILAEQRLEYPSDTTITIGADIARRICL